jgi:hypothetical protein
MLYSGGNNINTLSVQEDTVETVQHANLSIKSSAGQIPAARLAGWSALSVLLLWLASFAGAMLASSAFPGVADQFLPAKIQANVALASLPWLSQLALGTALVALAVPLSDYLASSAGWLYRFALISGIVAGLFLIAAGAGGQENVLTTAFHTPQQATDLAKAVGTSDLTVINVANDVVSGGMRSTAAYASAWSMVLWGIAALKTRKLPVALSWIQILTGVLYGLTVWIGPLVGPIAFLGMLIWSAWLAIYLLRAKSKA